MRRIAVLALYLVTWKTFVARVDAISTEVNGTPACELKSDVHQEEFASWFTAVARMTELRNQSENYDVRLWEFEEPVVKEKR